MSGERERERLKEKEININDIKGEKIREKKIRKVEKVEVLLG